jgi:thioredoxin-like negative regulator of GroEL
MCDTDTIIESPENRKELLDIINNNSNKLIILKFYAEWCKPCKEIHNFVEELFHKLDGEKLMIYINVDRSSNVSSYFRIKSIPTIITYLNGSRDKIINTSDKNQILNFFSIVRK